MTAATSTRKDRRRGSALVEFSTVALLLIMLIFTMFEMNRMLLVMTALADCARAGVRYAIVHGSDHAATAADIKGVIRAFASTGFLDTSRITIADPTYTACSTCLTNKDPGSTVDIKVIYAYDPLTSYFPLSINLGSSSEGIITF